MQEEKNTLSALSRSGLLRVSGVDAKAFLQGQITCNLEEVSSTKSCLGAHCNLKGRMQSLFRVLQQTNAPEQSSYGLVMPLEMLNGAQAGFKKYALFSKVSIESDNNMVALGLYGPQATGLLEVDFPEVGVLAQPYDALNKETSHGLYLICRLPGQLPRYEVWGTPEAIQVLWTRLSAISKTVLPEAWELLDIQAGIPTIYPQTVDLVLPHHANLSILKGISYSKGCYLGQEIIARMQYRGKIKKHLYRAYVQDINEMPMPGTTVHTTSEPGIVLRAAQNTTGLIELLVVLDDHFENFEDVCLYSADGPKIHRLDLPYST